MNNWMNVITYDKNRGNEFAEMIDPDVGGARTFDLAVRCYFPGTTFGAGFPPSASSGPAAYATGVAVSDGVAAMANEFNSPGPYTLLNAAGVSNAKVAAYKSVMTVECGPRGDFEGRLLAMIQESNLLTITVEGA